MNIKQVLDDIKKKLKKTGGKQPMRLLGNYALNLIRDRTRKGFGVPHAGGSKEPLKALSANYIQWRQKNKRKLSKFAKPSKSNLTRTGRMLESLRVIETKNFGFTIAPTGQSKEGVPNEDIARHHEKGIKTKKGIVKRPFLYLSQEEINQCIKFYEKEILKNALQ